MHVNLRGSLLLREGDHGFLATEDVKVSQDNPSDQLGTCLGACSKYKESISPYILEKTELVPQTLQ